jgi:hypothetical protein
VNDVFPECNSNADVVLVLDTSRYNTRSDVRNIKRFARDVVKRMAFRGNRFRVGVVEFGNSARTGLTFAEGDTKRTVMSVLGSLRSVGHGFHPNDIGDCTLDILKEFGYSAFLDLSSIRAKCLVYSPLP